MDNTQQGSSGVDIRSTRLMEVYQQISSEDSINSMTLILSSFERNTSYNKVLRDIESVLNINGKNRTIIKEWEEDQNQEVDEEGLEIESRNSAIKMVESTDDIITRILVEEVNEFIKEVEQVNTRPNLLKALVAKFLQSNFYYKESTLYKPKEYEQVILKFNNYPSQFTDFWQTGIERFEAKFPKSKLITLLKRQNNLALIRITHNITEYISAPPAERKLFSEIRKEYQKIINPPLPIILKALNMNKGTYEDNINIVTGKLVDKLNDPELTKKFNQIILNYGI